MPVISRFKVLSVELLMSIMWLQISMEANMRINIKKSDFCKKIRILSHRIQIYRGHLFTCAKFCAFFFFFLRNWSVFFDHTALMDVKESTTRKWETSIYTLVTHSKWQQLPILHIFFILHCSGHFFFICKFWDWKLNNLLLRTIRSESYLAEWWNQ